MILAVAIVGFVSSFNDYQKEKQFQALNKTAEQNKMVLYKKNGKEERKHEGLVVVGDVLLIEKGKNIPADGILIEGSKVECDESAMTGETHGCKKGTLGECMKRLEEETAGGKKISELSLHEIPSPIILSGSQVKSGGGRYLIITVGEESCVGKVHAQLKEKNTMTPLQKKLEGIADFIGKIGLYTAILTVAVLFIRYFISRISYGGWEGNDVGLCFGFIILGITVLIVAIPEGLPLAVTIALAYSVRKMYEEKNFVKTLMVKLNISLHL